VAPDGSAISPEVLHEQTFDEDLPVERVQTPRRPVVVQSPAPVPGDDVHGRHDLTEAGPGTGPGALGRRSRPQPVDPATIPAAGTRNPERTGAAARGRDAGRGAASNRRRLAEMPAHLRAAGDRSVPSPPAAPTAPSLDGGAAGSSAP